MKSPPILLPPQQRWFADSSPVRVAAKSRRVGLSWAEAGKSALEAARAGGQDTWYMGYSYDMAQQFIRDCGWWCGQYQLAADEMNEFILKDEDKDILSFQIRFSSGNRVTALSSSPRNLRSKKGRVVFDEAAFHPDLEELLKAAFALLIWGGSVSIISTHNGVDNPFNELVEDIRAGKKPYSLHTITFKEALAEGLYQRICQVTGQVWTPEREAAWEEEIRAIYRPNDAEELDCIPAQSGGAYLSRALIESRMAPDALVLRYECDAEFVHKSAAWREGHTLGWVMSELAPRVAAIPADARVSVGCDFGRTGDLSVFWPLVESQQLRRRTPFTLELRNVPFEQQKQILFWLCDNVPRLGHVALDARGNGQYLAEVTMQQYGASMVTQIMLTQQWYLEHMPRLKSALEDGDIETLPKDRDVLDDLRAIQVIKGIPRVPEGKTASASSASGQRHGDSAIALCAAWFAARQEGGPVEFMSDGPRSDAGELEAFLYG